MVRLKNSGGRMVAFKKKLCIICNCHDICRTSPQYKLPRKLKISGILIKFAKWKDIFEEILGQRSMKSWVKIYKITILKKKLIKFWEKLRKNLE